MCTVCCRSVLVEDALCVYDTECPCKGTGHARLGGYSAILHKEDNFFYFPVAFLSTSFFRELETERILSQGEQSLSF